MSDWASTPEEEFGTVVWISPGQIYADKGETVTCENGHPICEFLDSVATGQPFSSLHMGNWQQPEPKLGTIAQACGICGARWFKGPYLHFPNGWRVSR